jgi:hypothetical protein
MADREQQLRKRVDKAAQESLKPGLEHPTALVGNDKSNPRARAQRQTQQQNLKEHSGGFDIWGNRI